MPADLIAVVLRLAPAALSFGLLVLIAAVVLVLPPRGLVRHLGDDVGQEIEHFVLGHGLFQMRRGDAFRVAILGFLGGFCDEGDHEEFESFRCRRSISISHC